MGRYGADLTFLRPFFTFRRECLQTARWRHCGSAGAGRRFTAADGYDKTLRAMVVNGQLVTTHWDKLSGVGGAVRVSRTATSKSVLEPFLTNFSAMFRNVPPHTRRMMGST